MSRMKLLTVAGTRPEIIRLSRVIPLADKYFDHVFVHTSQNYDPSLKDVFFKDLRVREPNVFLPADGMDPVRQVGVFLSETEKIVREFKPDRFLVLGDTNSALTAWVAKRHGIPVFHMEAGNRCYDDRVPEEVNRRMIDQCSDILMPYTWRSRENLLREGFRTDRVFVTGNPIFEVFQEYKSEIEASKIFDSMSLKPGGYFLVTLHRAENVDIDSRLMNFLDGFERISKEHSRPVILSVHPRTRARLEKAGLDKTGLRERGIWCQEPFGFFDFAKLELNAYCVLTDSGTVQEECCIFGIPNITLRDVTERPETFDSGSNVLSGCEPDRVVQCVHLAVEGSRGWTPPEEYTQGKVSEKVIRILQSCY